MQTVRRAGDDMTDLEKAREIIEKYSGSTFHNAGQAYAWLEDRISAALAEARRDAIVEFCEGDRSKLAEIEQKAYAEGRKAAFEEKQDQYKSFRNGYQAGLEEAIQKIRDHKRSWQVSIEAIRALAKERK